MGERHMISIFLNNSPIHIQDNDSLLSVLQKQAALPDCYAIALNKCFIPSEQHADTYLKENDVIEIIVPMEGG
jgi:thiamine biosynthesis protein ThiS